MGTQSDFAKSDGPAAAAVLAAGLGVFLTGFLTTLAEVSSGIKGALVWYGPAGPLTGKTGAGVIVWLILWPILHMAWRDKEANFNRILVVSIVLVTLGWLLTFPPVFGAFGG